MTKTSQGRALTALGVLVLSPDALLVRLVTTDVWTVVWGRTALTALAIAVFLAVRHRGAAAQIIGGSLDRLGLLVAVLFGTGTVLFVLAVTYTAVANVLVILAAGPLFGAFLSRAFLAERIRTETWVASVAVLAGLAAIFADSLGTGSLFGDACALGASLATSAAFVTLRRFRGPSALVLVGTGSLLAAVAVTGLAHPGSITGPDLLVLVVLGGFVLPVAFGLIFIGPRHIPAPEVGLLMLLETALGPLWVWLVLAEVPTATVFAAGALVVATLAIHSGVTLRRERRA